MIFNRVKIIFGATVLGVSLLLTGCHGSKQMAKFEIPESFDEDKNIEISFWAKNDTNKAQTQVYYKAISDFEKCYPNIKVNMKLYTDYGRIYNDVITNIATKTTPDVCITYPDHILTYMQGNNVVVNLDDLLDNPEYGLGGSKVKFDSPSLNQIVPEYLEECRLDGSIYGLPYMRSTEACYINKNMLNALGYEVPDILTWDFVWEVAEKATETDSNGNYLINGQKIMIPFIYKSTDNMMIQQLYQKNAPYINEDGTVGLFNDTTKELLEDVAVHTKSGAFSTFKISSYPGNFLNAGQCVIAIDSTAGATWMGATAPLSDIPADKFIDFETVVRPVPQYDIGNHKMISQGPSLCLFNKEDPDKVMASWLFMQYLLTNDVQIGYSKTEGYVPVTTKARESKEYTEYLNASGSDDNEYYQVKIDATKMLLDNVEHTFVVSPSNGSASVRDAAGYLIENTAKSVRRKANIDDAYYDKLFADTNSLYRLDQIKGAVSGTQNNDLGRLPKESGALIAIIIIAWMLIIVYCVWNFYKNKNLE